jgi:hypothetical protein
VGGWLALISYSSSAQAKIIFGNILVEPLPSSVNTGILYSQQSLPQLQPASPLPVIEFQKSQPSRVAPVYQNNQHYEQRFPNRRYEQRFPSQHYEQRSARYLVYVDGDSIELLQQVRLIEPRAYIKQFHGRSVIQAGAFTREYYAQQRLAQLRSYGIDRTRIVSYSYTQESPNYSYTQPGRNYSYTQPGQNYSYRDESSDNFDRSDERRTRFKSYYVVIPTNSEDLPLIESRVRQSVGSNAGVIAKDHPRGLHVAVGPFLKEVEAQQWNDYLRRLGFGGARVYYGS